MSTPPTDTEPLVGEMGVRPVEPKVMLLTEAPGKKVDHCGAPFVWAVRNWPVVPGVIVAIGFVP